MAILVSNDNPQQQYPLTGHQHVLGRHPDCDIVIDVGAVSRHHARIYRDNDKFFVEDLGSRNGTFINGRPVNQQQEIRDGDQIRICDVSFTFRRSPDEDDSQKNLTILLEESAAPTKSTVWSKLDVSSDDSHLMFAVSPEIKLQALIEITRSLGKSLSLDQVLPQVLNSLFKIFLQADRGCIVLRDEKGNLVPRWSKVRHEGSDETIRISKTIVNDVMTSKQAMLSADATSDSRFELSESIADFRIRSVICAPLINSDGEALGVIQIDTKDQRKRFRQEDLEVLASVAIQAATAIENAQLHEQILQQKELERELQLARDVQKSFLPKHRPKIEGYEFYDFYQPAKHVGGDYYDYVELPNGRLAVVIADVVGKGIAAALMMSKLSAAVRLSVGVGLEPAEMLQSLNQNLLEGEFDGRFITMVIAVLDPLAHTVTFSSAGHEAFVWKRASKNRIERPGRHIAGYPLLIDDFTEYQQETIQLEPGDVIAGFTDGLYEAMDAQNAQFGIERIEQAMLNRIRSARDGALIVEEIEQFIQAGQYNDDMCLVCLSRQT